jgi:hypothetical protein
MLSALLPKCEVDACFDDIREGSFRFSSYLSGTILGAEVELVSRQITYALNDKPHDAMSSLHAYNAVCFLNVRMPLTIFASLLTSTATARSFSVLKLVKSILRSRKGEEHVSI